MQTTAFLLPSLLAATLAAGPLAAQAPPPVTVLFADVSGSTPVLLGSASLTAHDPFTLLPDTAGIAIGPRGMDVDRENGHLYYTVQGAELGIRRMNLNGTGDEPVVLFDPVHGPHFPQGVAVDTVHGRLYWIAGSGETRIGSCELDGSDLQSLVTYNEVLPIVSPSSIDVDPIAGKLYWRDAAIGFRSCDLDGDDVQTVLDLTGVNEVNWDVDVVNGYLYYGALDTLYRAPVDGSAPPAPFLVEPAVFLHGQKLAVVPESDVVVWQPSGNDVHWTSLSAPGAIHTTPLSGYAVLGSIEAMPGPEVVLNVEPEPVPPGGPVEFRISGALPSTATWVFLTKVNGAPLVAPILSALPLDAMGAATLALPVGPSASGLTAEFVGVAFDPSGFPVVTLPEEVAFL